MIKLDLDVRYGAERCARREQSRESGAIDDCCLRGHEVVSRLGLERARTWPARERGDQTVGTASTEREGIGGSGHCDEDRYGHCRDATDNQTFIHGSPPMPLHVIALAFHLHDRDACASPLVEHVGIHLVLCLMIRKV